MKEIYYAWDCAKIDLEFHQRSTRKAFNRVAAGVADEHSCTINNLGSRMNGCVWSPPEGCMGLRDGERGWVRIAMMLLRTDDEVLNHESGHAARFMVDAIINDREGVPRAKPPRGMSRGVNRSLWREELILHTQWSLYEFLRAWRKKKFVYTQDLPPIKMYDQNRDEYLLT